MKEDELWRVLAFTTSFVKPFVDLGHSDQPYRAEIITLPQKICVLYLRTVLATLFGSQQFIEIN